MRWVELFGSLNILWHCLSLGLKWKLNLFSPVITAEFSKFAGTSSAALSKHHLLGFNIAQLEFHNNYSFFFLIAFYFFLLLGNFQCHNLQVTDSYFSMWVWFWDSWDSFCILQFSDCIFQLLYWLYFQLQDFCFLFMIATFLSNFSSISFIVFLILVSCLFVFSYCSLNFRRFFWIICQTVHRSLFLKCQLLELY